MHFFFFKSSLKSLVELINTNKKRLLLINKKRVIVKLSLLNVNLNDNRKFTYRKHKENSLIFLFEVCLS